MSVLPLLERKLARDCRALAGQAAALVLVVACAVATAVMSFGVLRSLERTRAEYYERYGFADLFASVPRAPQSAAEALRRLEGVALVQERLVLDTAADLPDMDEPLGVRLISLPEDGAPRVNAVALREGRYPGRADAHEVLVAESFARAHGLAPGARLAARLGGRRQELVVVGIALSPEYIYSLGPGMIAPDDRRFGVLWATRRLLEGALGASGEFNDLAIRLAPAAPAHEVMREVEALLEPYGTPDVHGRSRQLSHAFVSSMLHQIAGIGRIVPAIFLLVAAFLVHSVLGRLVDTQRQQIGLMKALGIAEREIGWHYLKLALALGAIGIVAGLAAGTLLGHGLTRLYTQFFHFPLLRYEPDLAAAAVAATVSLGATAAGALRSVRAAAALAPAAALQPRSPAHYGRTCLERLAPRGLPASATIVLRHLERWPVRAALTVGGLSLAVALQIAMLFSFDALDRMINCYYRRAQAEDFTLSFARALPRGVEAEIARRPGVLRVEGFRALPVQLGSGAGSRVVSLTGLPGTGTLRALLDAELARVPVPREGLALPGKLAALLQVRAGEAIAVRPLGSNERFELPVARIIEQYVGLDAYIDLDELNRLLGEGPRISGAYLRVDPGRRRELLHGLKDDPLLAGISERAAVIASFRDTMVRTLTIIVSFFVAFACLTALGIVFSSAQIMLSEQEREFATLAALGFSAAELRRILGGELALLVAAALPLGCALGSALAWAIVQRLDTELYRVPLALSARTVASAVLLVVAAALVSALLAARQLARTDVPAVLNARL